MTELVLCLLITKYKLEANNTFTDCTLCPDSVSCNDVTGCEACQGSYQPECKQSRLLINFKYFLINVITKLLGT